MNKGSQRKYTERIWKWKKHWQIYFMNETRVYKCDYTFSIYSIALFWLLASNGVFMYIINCVSCYSNCTLNFIRHIFEHNFHRGERILPCIYITIYSSSSWMNEWMTEWKKITHIHIFSSSLPILWLWTFQFMAIRIKMHAQIKNGKNAWLEWISFCSSLLWIYKMTCSKASTAATPVIVNYIYQKSCEMWDTNGLCDGTSNHIGFFICVQISHYTHFYAFLFVFIFSHHHIFLYHSNVNKINIPICCLLFSKCFKYVRNILWLFWVSWTVYQ